MCKMVDWIPLFKIMFTNFFILECGLNSVALVKLWIIVSTKITMCTHIIYMDIKTAVISFW